MMILAGAALALTLSACGREEQPDDNQVITDINAAQPGDIEALPPGESVDLPADNASGEEVGDGDEMVNIVDDTGNRG
jgi:hypothetical protein